MFEHKPPRVRLVGLDLDKTALNSQRKITPRVRAAIAAATAAGIAVLPATGRARSAVPRAFLEIPGVRYAVCANGAKVYDVAEDTVLLSDCFSQKDALALLALCEENGILPCVFIDGGVYSNSVDLDEVRAHSGQAMVDYLVRSRTFVPDVRAMILQGEHPVEKFSLQFFNMPLRERAKTMFTESGLCAVTWSLKDNLELNTPTANKGAALLLLGARLGIPRAEIMAVGDSTNDLTMLQSVGYSVGMAASHPLVLQAVHDITASADEDGVALALEAVLGQAAPAPG